MDGQGINFSLYITHINNEFGYPIVFNTQNQAKKCVYLGSNIFFGDLLITKQSKVELRNKYGILLRLTEESEVSIQYDDINKSLNIILFGSFFKAKYDSLLFNQHGLSYKIVYRDIFFTYSVGGFVVENIDEYNTAIYSIDEDLVIFSVAYSKNKSSFLSIPKGFLAILFHSEKMRDKKSFKVILIEAIRQKDYHRLYQTYFDYQYWKNQNCQNILI